MIAPTPTWRLVLSRLLPPRRAGFALCAVIGAATVLPLLAPQLTRRFVDGAIAGKSTSLLTLLALGYLGVGVCGQLARTVTAWLASRAAWGGTNRLREVLAGHALGLDMAYHQQACGRLYRTELRADRIGRELFAATSVAFAAGTAIMLGLAAGPSRPAR